METLKNKWKKQWELGTLGLHKWKWDWINGNFVILIPMINHPK
jgi:hypothetical protein